MARYIQSGLFHNAESFLQNLQREEQRHAPIVNLTDEAKRALILKLKASIDDATECPVSYELSRKPMISNRLT